MQTNLTKCAAQSYIFNSYLCHSAWSSLAKCTQTEAVSWGLGSVGNSAAGDSQSKLAPTVMADFVP